MSAFVTLRYQGIEIEVEYLYERECKGSWDEPPRPESFEVIQATMDGHCPNTHKRIPVEILDDIEGSPLHAWIEKNAPIEAREQADQVLVDRYLDSERIY